MDDINEQSINYNNEQLIKNINKNNIDEVIKLLHEGADIDCVNGYPLIHSIQKGYYQLTKLLLDMNANININNGIALFFACMYNENEITELLLNKGIHYQPIDNDYNEIIMLCIKNDNSYNLELLTEHDIIKIIANQKLNFMDYGTKQIFNLVIFDTCLKHKSKNIIEFLIDNHPEIIPEDIDESLIKQKDIRKYNFIKMLINRNLIDVPD